MDFSKYLKGQWILLKGTVQQQMRPRPEARDQSFEELYRYAYQVYTQKHGKILYSGLEDIVQRQLKSKDPRDQDNVIQIVNEVWLEHEEAMVAVGNAFSCIRPDGTQQQGVDMDDVRHFGLQLFMDEVLKDEVRTCLSLLLLDLVLADRQGQAIDKLAVRNCLTVLKSLDREIYEELFEIPYLEQSAEFYRVKGQEFREAGDPTLYAEAAAEFMKEETERSFAYLDPSTDAKRRETMETEMFHKHSPFILGLNGRRVLENLESKGTAKLNSIYGLLRLVHGGHKILADIVKSYIEQHGHVLAMKKADVTPAEYIESLIALKRLIDFYLDACFEKDAVLDSLLTPELQRLVNHNKSVPEFLCIFMDRKLRERPNSAAEEELLQTTLDQSLELFRFLSEKDLFEQLFKSCLGTRLLSDSSVPDNESYVISKLKMECGSGFSNNLEAMIKDLQISKDLVQEFRSSAFAAQAVDLDFNIRILATGIWLQNPKCFQVALPSAPLRAFDAFKRFYSTKFSCRRLTLQPQLGSADVNFLKSSSATHGGDEEPGSSLSQHLLHVSTYQMCILLLFSTNQQLSFEQILGSSQIPALDLKRALARLSQSTKQQILEKTPATKEFASSDVFHVNEKFSSSHFRIKIHAGGTEGHSESKKMPQVDVERVHEIEAVIVRIMKSRKTLQHSNLVAEVIAECSHRFHPDPAVIKKRIERLLDRDYLTRTDQDRNVYSYVA